jgi:hypothetical protein
MIFRQILLFAYFFVFARSSRIIDIVFTVKNLSTNEELKSNFFTMINSLFEHTSKDNLHLHVIGDVDSHLFVDQTLHNLQYNHQVSII